MNCEACVVPILQKVKKGGIIPKMEGKLLWLGIEKKC